MLLPDLVDAARRSYNEPDNAIETITKIRKKAHNCLVSVRGKVTQVSSIIKLK